MKAKAQLIGGVVFDRIAARTGRDWKDSQDVIELRFSVSDSPNATHIMVISKETADELRHQLFDAVTGRI